MDDRWTFTKGETKNNTFKSSDGFVIFIELLVIIGR